MWCARLIQELLKRLCQMLAALITSSAQRLRILVSCFRRFVTKIRGQLKHNTSVAQCDTVTSISSSWCPQVTSLLPLHDRRAASSTPDSNVVTVTVSSTPYYGMPTASVPQQANSPQTSFVPFTPGDVSRYINRPLVDTSRTYNPLPVRKRHFPNESCPWLIGGGGWKSYVHPEGALYLYNATGSRRTYTEANIDENLFRALDGCVGALYDDLLCDDSGDIGTDDIELVVQLTLEKNEVYCQYYFVDHNARMLFWLHDPKKVAESLFSALQGVYDPSHMGYALEEEYWVHCERYPNHKMNRVELVKELRELVMHASAEIITSDSSLSPFDADELSRILELISHLQENAGDDISPHPHSIFVIARFMQYFARAKFFNFCGLPCARLDADKSIYPDATGFHPLISSLSFALEAMLFWAPRARLKDLQRVWVDEAVIMPRWKDFNRNLMAEWTGITIYSTVMLAVDISFLAVPNVYIGQSQSIGIIATYLSIIFITGSLIISLLLARQNQKYGYESADKATEFLSNISGSLFGMKGLATVHSLPYAMLMWGMVCFAIALLYNVFKSHTIAMLASVVSGCTAVVMFISWFLWTGKIRQLLLLHNASD
ncbi:hypothetical protein M405DRAFT_802979 [Rhizopogon salebrosus TDB-379]|nr:hypothetical protein M405DRAFT_802979 [Rhizopogon salebrosus TDB-379]